MVNHLTNLYINSEMALSNHKKRASLWLTSLFGQKKRRPNRLNKYYLGTFALLLKAKAITKDLEYNLRAWQAGSKNIQRQD